MLSFEQLFQDYLQLEAERQRDSVGLVLYEIICKFDQESEELFLENARQQVLLFMLVLVNAGNHVANHYLGDIVDTFFMDHSDYFSKRHHGVSLFLPVLIGRGNQSIFQEQTLYLLAVLLQDSLCRRFVYLLQLIQVIKLHESFQLLGLHAVEIEDYLS